MLWEMLCGRPLFLGASIQATLSRLLFAPIMSPRQLRSDIPADLERVAMRLLARELPERYQTATSAMVDLIACSDYPRSGRELLRGLMRTRFGGEASDTHLSGARTALDSRRPLPPPSDARTPQAKVAQTRSSSSRKLVFLILAVGLIGTALGLLVASGVNRPIQGESSSAGAGGSVVLGHDASPERLARASSESRVSNATSQAHDPAADATTPPISKAGQRRAHEADAGAAAESPAPVTSDDHVPVPQFAAGPVYDEAVEIYSSKIRANCEWRDDQRLQVSFKVAPEGRAANIRIDMRDSHGDVIEAPAPQRLQKCVRDALTSTAFPRSREGGQ